jgi:hypothetical protein
MGNPAEKTTEHLTRAILQVSCGKGKRLLEFFVPPRILSQKAGFWRKIALFDPSIVARQWY